MAVRLSSQVLSTLPLQSRSKSSRGHLRGGAVGDRHWLRESPTNGQVLLRGLCVSEKNLERTFSLALQSIIKMLTASGFLNPFQTRILKCRGLMCDEGRAE